MPAEGMLLGYFGKAGSGKSGPATHVVVVNLDYRNAVTATVVGPGRLDVFDATAGKWKRASGPRAALALPPGGGVLVRVRD